MKRTWFLPRVSLTYLEFLWRIWSGAGHDVNQTHQVGRWRYLDWGNPSDSAADFCRLHPSCCYIIHQHFCWSNTPEILKNGPHITQNVKEFPSSLVFHIINLGDVFKRNVVLESSGWLELSRLHELASWSIHAVSSTWDTLKYRDFPYVKLPFGMKS